MNDKLILSSVLVFGFVIGLMILLSFIFVEKQNVYYQELNTSSEKKSINSNYEKYVNSMRGIIVYNFFFLIFGPLLIYLTYKFV